jgi:Trm5-related predicted tRNA methylase
MLYGQDLLDVIKGDLVEVNLSQRYNKHLNKKKKDWDNEDYILSANYTDIEELIKEWCNIESEDFELIIRFKKGRI